VTGARTRVSACAAWWRVLIKPTRSPPSSVPSRPATSVAVAAAAIVAHTPAPSHASAAMPDLPSAPGPVPFVLTQEYRKTSKHDSDNTWGRPFINHYIIGPKIGEGVHGNVKLAVDAKDKRQVVRPALPSCARARLCSRECSGGQDR
jgi:hypothetical protein